MNYFDITSPHVWVRKSIISDRKSEWGSLIKNDQIIGVYRMEIFMGKFRSAMVLVCNTDAVSQKDLQLPR